LVGGLLPDATAVFVLDPKVNVVLGVAISEFVRRKSEATTDGDLGASSVAVRRISKLGEAGVEEAPPPKTNTLLAAGEDGAPVAPNIGKVEFPELTVPKAVVGEPKGLEGALPL
jgi:hypothetical protein